MAHLVSLIDDLCSCGVDHCSLLNIVSVIIGADVPIRIVVVQEDVVNVHTFLIYLSSFSIFYS